MGDISKSYTLDMYSEDRKKKFDEGWDRVFGKKKRKKKKTVI